MPITTMMIGREECDKAYIVSSWPPYNYDSLHTFGANVERFHGNTIVIAVATDKVPAFCDCLAQEIAKRDGLDDAEVELHAYDDPEAADEAARLLHEELLAAWLARHNQHREEADNVPLSQMPAC